MLYACVCELLGKWHEVVNGTGKEKVSSILNSATYILLFNKYAGRIYMLYNAVPQAGFILLRIGSNTQ